MFVQGQKSWIFNIQQKSNPVSSISNLWKTHPTVNFWIFGKLIQNRANSRKIIFDEFWGMTQTDVWKTYPNMVGFSRSRSSLCPGNWTLKKYWMSIPEIRLCHTPENWNFGKKFWISFPGNFVFEIKVGKKRIRHRTTLHLNDVIFDRFWVDLKIHHLISESLYIGSDHFRHWFQKMKWLGSGLPLIFMGKKFESGQMSPKPLLIHFRFVEINSCVH